jgi:CHAT domain-containing protein
MIVQALVGAGAFLVLSTTQPATLAPGDIVSRHLARDATDRYVVSLAADEYVRVVVEQRGVDVVVTTLDPDGQLVGEFQSQTRSHGEEPVEIISGAAGSYTLAIRPFDGALVSDESTYAIRIVSRHQATPEDRMLRESRKLHATGSIANQAGRYEEAAPLLARAAELIAHLPQVDPVYVGTLLTERAGLALEQHRNVEARALYARAVDTLTQSLGPDYPTTAFVRSRLAAAEQRLGNLSEAIRLVEPACASLERSVGPDHNWLARCLLTLGNIRSDLGDDQQAEAWAQRALQILDHLQQSDSITYSSLLNNLALIYQKREDYSRAEAYMRRSLAIGERLRGSESYYVSNTLQNLGIIAKRRKDYVAAEHYYTRSLQIRERLAGPDHPDVAILLNNLGNVYAASGDTARALETHFRGLHILEHASYDPRLIVSLSSIARIYAATGQIGQAVAFRRRIEEIAERQFSANLVIGSERQKLAMSDQMAERTDRTISLHLQQAIDDPEAGTLAVQVLLQRKGRVLDVMTDAFAAVRQRLADAGDQDLLDEYNRISTDLAQVVLAGPRQDGLEAYDRRVSDLRSRKEKLEADLSSHSPAFRAQVLPVTLAAVQAELPENAALIELAVFHPFDPKADDENTYGPPHYAAYVVRKHGPARGLDLGPARSIEEAVDAFRQSLRDPSSRDVEARARVVDEKVLQPLRPALGEATRLLISPDGDLNLVPFEALVDERGQYLIQRYAISYLTSGRDLLRMQAPPANSHAPVVIADPFFGEPGTPTLASLRLRGQPDRGDDAATTDSGLYFAPLGATAAEARAIKTLFPDARLFLGRAATKATVQAVQAPRLLHIASHGFFLPEASTDHAPLLRSGIALAGANLTATVHHDGILTALEASGLNLWGTRLVTLSACDTGVGEVRNGEGVYGLRRAFVLAGAETLVMSLWPVSDYITREFMTTFYTGLRAGAGRGDALQQAKLRMLTRPGRAHPYYWASFIESGEWANLDGQR